MKMMSSNASARNYKSPFTANQWQELEHQALIFKYMVSGMPIPLDLLYSVKRSLNSSRNFSQHPNGWGCFEMGFGRKVDPEPGRCRRTDGKKWRCSKEAYPDSKYCERHMHRGRNRSRKPVEVSSAAARTPITTNSSAHSISSINRNPSLLTNPNTPSTSFTFSPIPSESHRPFSHSFHNSSSHNPFLSTHSPLRPPGSDFSPQSNNTTHLFLDSGSCSHQGEKGYRPIQGTRDGLDERTFFPEASETSRSYSTDPYENLAYKSYSESHFNRINEYAMRPEQHLFVMGTDFKSPKPSKSSKEEDETQRPLHQFFGEWQQTKETDTWLDLAPHSRNSNED